MRKFILTWVCLGLATFLTQAQETNRFKTEIENFEALTNTVIVRGFGQVGSVSLGGGVLTIRSKESIDVSHARKLYGVVIELSGEGISRQRAIVDEDEIELVLGGLDYLLKITSDVTAMPAFEAKYATKAGLCFSAQGTRRQPGIQFFLRFDDEVKLDLNTDQLNQIRGFISQARNGINALK